MSVHTQYLEEYTLASQDTTGMFHIITQNFTHDQQAACQIWTERELARGRDYYYYTSWTG
jgi:hypothetical protein